MNRLKNIVFKLPTNTPEEMLFFNNIIDFLSLIPNSNKENNSVTFKPNFPKGALPLVKFENTSKNIYPYLLLNDINEEVNIISNNFIITNNDEINETKYNEGYNINNKILNFLDIETFKEKFKEYIVRIDHLGINIPSIDLSKNEFYNMIGIVAKYCNLYRYPINDNWPFIIPSCENEFINDIKEFKFGRDPKFEFVYDTYANIPVIQIDIETNLERKAVENLLPDPFGISFKAVADYFRSVYIKTPWKNFLLRVDVRFKNNQNEEDSTWETGKWLVQDGVDFKNYYKKELKKFCNKKIPQ